LAFAGILHAFAQSNPPAINYITYLPAASATQIAFDSAGSAYVAGTYFNSRYSCTWPLGAPSTGNQISFATKLNPNGDGVVWTICMPGLSAAVAVDGGGSIYVASGANGSSTVTKLSPTYGKVIYSTSIASSVPSSIAVDRAGNAYHVGDRRPISIHDHDVRTLRSIPAECDRILHPQPGYWIPVVCNEAVNPKLTNYFFGFYQYLFLATPTVHIRLSMLLDEKGFKSFDSRRIQK
jgi:hypothetical protein